MTSNFYITYDDPLEVAQLDRNTYDASRAVVFPRHLYSGNVVPDPHYLCDRPRDTELNYIIGVERENHPDHYSRFGYARNFYGYSSGHWPGRYQEDRECTCSKYQDYSSQDCSKCSQHSSQSCSDFNPPGMAPERFYLPTFEKK